jgi:enamine deaminase RidA (YjgF/YER057c/UK114 family)
MIPSFISSDARSKPSLPQMAVMTVLDLNNVTQAIEHYSAIEAMVGGKILVSPQTALSSFMFCRLRRCARPYRWHHPPPCTLATQTTQELAVTRRAINGGGAAAGGVKANDLLFLSGQVAVDPATGI